MKKVLYSFVLILLISASALLAESKRMVLIEEVTSGNCGTCAYLNVAFNDFIRTHQDVLIPAIYHSGNGAAEFVYDQDPSFLSSRIWGVYVSGTLGTPAAWSNGTKLSDLTAINGEYYKYKDDVSPYSIYVFESRNGSSIDVTVIVKTDVDIVNKSLIVESIEDNVKVSPKASNGESLFPWVVRGMFPGPSPTQAYKLNMTAGQTKSFNLKVNIPTYCTATNFYMIAFIQDLAASNKAVLQAAKTGDSKLAVPQIAYTDQQVLFDNVKDATTQTFNITNSGLAKLNIQSISIMNDNNQMFQITGTKPTFMLPGDSYDIPIKFSPVENGTSTASLVIVTDSKTDATLNIPITGIASGVVPKPAIIVDLSTVDFSSQSGKTIQTLKINNNGKADLTVNTLTISGENVFKLETTAPFTLKPAESKDVNISFNPIDNKAYSANLIIASNANNTPSLSVPLKGTGSGIIKSPSISCDFAKLDFGTCTTSKLVTLKISNTGSGDMSVTNFTFTPDDGVFSTTVKTFPFTIKANTVFNLLVQFTPKGNATYSAQMSIESNASNNPSYKVDLTAIGSGLKKVEDDTANNTEQQPTFTITPNPTSGLTHIDINGLNNNALDDLGIYDVSGNKVGNIKVCGCIRNTFNADYDCSDLITGTYYIIAKSGQKKFSSVLSVARK
ncbi:MAG: choice-of-anchor D domain-containing protein [Candidatus Kapabacteria bacterium]|nr:choice-of-anchor D domain-containing protein [Candidatus Kapabacteria bacterium]